MVLGESNVLLDIILPSDTYEFASNPIQPEMINVFEAEAVAPEAQDKQDIFVMGMTASYEDELIV